MLTNFALLTNEQKTIWSKELWKNARNQSFVNRFLGSGPMSLVQHITELKKSEKGARAVITLLADLTGDGIAGDRTLEGNEESMQTYDQVIRIDHLRHANRHEGKMADQKSVVEFRGNSRDVLSYWLADRYTEQQKATDARWMQLMGSFERIDDKWIDMIDDDLNHCPASPYFTDESKSQ